mmetsp:Transcript_54282/g.174030  ORF Transcript_54282/g.174030 Transcript_54282/m.174030 type:complete len:218 (+) Transcript_54282:1536-2189(+)
MFFSPRLRAPAVLRYHCRLLGMVVKIHASQLQSGTIPSLLPSGLGLSSQRLATFAPPALPSSLRNGLHDTQHALSSTGPPGRPATRPPSSRPANPPRHTLCFEAGRLTSLAVSRWMPRSTNGAAEHHAGPPCGQQTSQPAGLQRAVPHVHMPVCTLAGRPVRGRRTALRRGAPTPRADGHHIRRSVALSVPAPGCLRRGPGRPHWPSGTGPPTPPSC